MERRQVGSFRFVCRRDPTRGEDGALARDEEAKVTNRWKGAAVENGEVLSLDALAGICGYFHSLHNANNGYCCAHPKQEMRDEEGHGCCYSFSCPLAYELDPDDEEDLKLAGFTDPGDMSEGFWVQVHTPPRKSHVLDSVKRAAETRKRRKQNDGK